jgi:hypothetical protein
MRFVLDVVALELFVLQVSLVFSYLLLFHHCCIFIYHCSITCVLALTMLRIITSSAFKLGTSSLTQNLTGCRLRRLRIWFLQLFHCLFLLVSSTMHRSIHTCMCAHAYTRAHTLSFSYFMNKSLKTLLTLGLKTGLGGGGIENEGDRYTWSLSLSQTHFFFQLLHEQKLEKFCWLWDWTHVWDSALWCCTVLQLHMCECK